jgi:hypothetical protein
MKTFEITMYNNVQTALIHLGHMKADCGALLAAKPPRHLEEGNSFTLCKGGLAVIQRDGVVFAEWGDNIASSGGFGSVVKGARG